MTVRWMLPVVFAAAVVAIAQTNDPPAPPPAKPAAEAKPAPRETPPDQKAFFEANKITDPEKKIEAIKKWKADFPNSEMQEGADSTILHTLTTKLPEQTARIRSFAVNYYRGAKPKNKASAATGIADEFLTANILLKDADTFARKAVDSMKLGPYMAEQTAAYEKRKQKPPSSEELKKRFDQSRASRLAILGRIEVKLGRAAAGQKMLEQSYSVNPDNGAVDSVLGELAAKRGDDAKAFEYLVQARLSGKSTKTANTAFEAIYRKQHNGLLDGLDAMLDEQYHKRYPNPVHVEAYKPSEKRTTRVVLAEVFTGAGCPPCVSADLAYEGAMERYNTKELIVAMYHQHIPQPDPMTNLDTRARLDAFKVGGVPTWFIDGTRGGGGGPRDTSPETFGRINPAIEKELEIAPEAQIKMDAALAGNSVKVNATVDEVKSEAKQLKVFAVLMEKELRYTGENGIRFHPMVVRAVAEGAIDTAFEHTFDLEEISKSAHDHLDDYEAKGHRGEPFQFTEKKYEINRGNLAVAVFVQDTESHHVLQAAFVDLSGHGPRPTTEAGAR